MLKNKTRAGLKLLKCKLFNLRIPIVFSIEVTSRCNYNCEYCGYNGEKDEFSTEEFLNIISEMDDLGTERIILTGGEPLIRNDIKQIINHAKKHGLEVNLNTNGYYTKQKIDEISNVDKITFSLDGNKKVFNELRQEGAHEKVLEGIKLTKEKDINCDITAVITNQNIDQFDYLVNLARKLDIAFNFQPMITSPYGSDNTDILPNVKDLKKIITKAKVYKIKYPSTIEPSLRTLNLMEKKYIENKRVQCVEGNISARIEDKRIMPCSRFKKSIKISSNLKEAWNDLISDFNCDRKCSTGDLELVNLWNLEPETIKNQLFSIQF